MKKVFIIDGLRTPIGGLNKSLKGISASELAATVLKELVKRSDIGKELVDEVIMGNAVGAGLGQNMARQSLIKAGLKTNTPAFTVNKICGSGLKAVILAAQSILCQDSGLILAGGTESASNCPFFVPRNKKTDILKNEDLKDSLIHDGLWCSINNSHMGTIAEQTAREFKITRQEQDAYALQSHEKACRAQEEGLFKNEIVPISIGNGLIIDKDDRPRKNTSIERLARIPGAFEPGGTVTAGNSPQPADGAAAVIIASEKAVADLKLKPVASILGYTSVAVEPKDVYTAPALAIKQCMQKSSLNLNDVDLFEMNEAFAVQALLTIKQVGLDKSCLNVFGGTIALGHPLGASGARGLVTLINALKTRKKTTGITSICLGGGSAVSMAIKIIS